MLQILLILLIIGATALHLWGRSLKVEEPFVSSTGPGSVAGMPPKPRLAPAVDDPIDDPLDLPWIASWSPMDRAARYGQTCRMTFVEDGPCDTTIETVSASCEAGMPHTRAGDRIILPESIQLPDREEIIRHELVHIFQKRNPDSWMEFYRRNWSFTFASMAPQGMPQKIQDARRSNPDTWDMRSGGPWACWMNRWWPVPIYRTPDDPQLRDALTVWWDSATGEVLYEPPADWTAFFGHPTQNEHPHEIAATLLVGGNTGSEAGRRLQNWWRSEGRRNQVDPDSVCPL